jgi:hypothetical protein
MILACKIIEKIGKNEFFPRKVCAFRKKILPLQPQKQKPASVAQLVRAPDC